jgi:mannose/fructose/N-acetylgalactosamine-specific phosphotransferase system component IID
MSLYPDNMTKEEVVKEFARLIAPTIRRMYDEYEKEKKEAKEKKKKPINEKPHRKSFLSAK